MAVSEDFWITLDNFRASIVCSGDLAEATAATRRDANVDEDNMGVLAKCEGIIENVVASLSRGEPPVLRVPRPSRSDPFGGVAGGGGGGGGGEQGAAGTGGTGGEALVSLGGSRSHRRISLLLHLLSQVHRLVASGTYATRRDVFYEFVWLYRSQGTLDRAAEDLTRLLAVPRRALHLTATGKGLVAGYLTYTTHDGTVVNVAQAGNGVGVPDCVAGLAGLQSEARYVLVVEKDATFQKLLESHFLRSFGPAIMVTGKGYPDLNTRQLVYRLWRDLQLPILALTDADPYGLHIAAVYKFGALAREEQGLSVSSLAWLGVLPTDLRGLQLPAHALLPLTPKDHGKLASLAAHPALSRHPAWVRQIEEQQRLGCKAEIQGLTHVAQDYLSTTYLPTKLRQGGWVG
ncbi:meiotic recombination protein SPO11-like [Eriocheir sinensis]|uniref:meiotic recombination protein SPO11-like n=1 Tax=Eriocheir sinensis TaxID=95602 RepID=UPI0021C5FBAB|nr:meiotic recombination protein SPO11-like [Eriocheir sinensis]